MSMSMSIDPKVVELVSALLISEEGESLCSYLDGGRVWTVGIGHTGPDVHAGIVITDEQAVAVLMADESGIFEAIAKQDELLRVKTGRFATAGYVSFGFNCGLGALHSVFRGEAQIGHYIHDHLGIVEKGLVRRRRLELALIAADS
jgi:lysozyme